MKPPSIPFFVLSTGVYWDRGSESGHGSRAGRVTDKISLPARFTVGGCQFDIDIPNHHFLEKKKKKKKRKRKSNLGFLVAPKVVFEM